MRGAPSFPAVDIEFQMFVFNPSALRSPIPISGSWPEFGAQLKVMPRGKEAVG